MQSFLQHGARKWGKCACACGNKPAAAAGDAVWEWTINWLSGVNGGNYRSSRQIKQHLRAAEAHRHEMETGISEKGAPGRPFLNLCWEKTRARKVTQDFACEDTSSYFS